MPNTYFKFKQFTIHQGDCAMKVTTDACIFGAWIENHNPGRILDIGAGTGLLSLMLAQRFSAEIDAVEIEGRAAQQARENIAQSPWKNRVHLYNEDIIDFADNTDCQYDLIISNPPFFNDNLKATSQDENLARHNDALPTSELCRVIAKKLTSKGVAFILLPEYESHLLLDMLNDFQLKGYEALTIRHDRNTKVLRKIIGIRKNANFDSIDKNVDFLIKDSDRHYTNQFLTLLTPYYASL